MTQAAAQSISSSERAARRWRELRLLLLILLPFVALNLATAPRSPTIWKDEVMFADAAANAVLRRGFFSSAWPAQSVQETWAGNAPLHTWLLIPWIKLWGFSPTAVRSVNYVYASLGAILLWVALWRSGLLQHRWARLGAVLLLLCEHCVTFGYRSGRYDTLGLLLVLAALAAATVRNPATRAGCLVLLGVLMPLAGLYLLPFIATVCLLLLAFYKARSLRWTLPLGLGVALGGGLLLAILAALGGLPGFFRSVHHYHRDLPQRLAILRGTLADFAALDVSAVLALAALLLALVYLRHRLILLSLALAVCVPAALTFSSGFPPYYAWMVGVPAMLAALTAADMMYPKHPFVARVLALLLVVGALLGLPLRLARMGAEWSARSYAPVADFVPRHVSASDVVLADPQTFYAIKPIARMDYYPYYLASATAAEKRAINKIILQPEDLAEVKKELGGDWEEIAWLNTAPGQITRWSRAGARSYALTVCRRVTKRSEPKGN